MRLFPRSAFLLLILAGAAQAQETDEEWLEQCRSPRFRSSDRPARHCEVRVLRLPAGGTVRGAGDRNGGFSVVGGNTREVIVHARIQVHAETDREAREAARTLRIETQSGLRTEGPALTDDVSWTVVYFLEVPSSTDLDLVTHNGPLSVANVTGTLRLETHNGPLSLNRVGGDVRARARNGPLFVRLSGAHWSGAGLDAETVNGPIQLRIPENYNARLETGTANGPLSVDFPLNVTLHGSVHRRISSTLGNGGALVRAVTTNGPVSISRL